MPGHEEGRVSARLSAFKVARLRAEPVVVFLRRAAQPRTTQRGRRRECAGLSRAGRPRLPAARRFRAGPGARTGVSLSFSFQGDSCVSTGALDTPHMAPRPKKLAVELRLI